MVPPLPPSLVDPSPVEALALAERLFGAVHRLAWDGDDTAGDRRRLLAWFQELLQRGFEGEEPQRRLAALADWWLQAALGAGQGWAWGLGEWLAVPRLSAPLLKMLEAGMLRDLEQPRRFRRALQELEALAARNVNFSKTPGPKIYQDARVEASRLVRAARESPGHKPAREEFKLFSLPTDEWASEIHDQHQLQRGLKVWNSLQRHLSELQQAAEAVWANWTEAAPYRPELPENWALLLHNQLPDAQPFADALLHDALALDERAPQRTPRALLREWPIAGLQELPADLPLGAQARVLALVREADPPAVPAWAEGVAARLSGISEEITRLQAQAADTPEAAAWLAEAAELQALKPGEAEAALDLAREALAGRRQGAAQRRLEGQILAWNAELAAAGLASPEQSALLQPAEGEEIAAHHARVQAAFQAGLAALGAELSPLEGALASLPGAAATLAGAAEVRRLLERERLSAARRALAALQDDLQRAWSRQEAALPAELRALWQRGAALDMAEKPGFYVLVERAAARLGAGLAAAGLIAAAEGLATGAPREILAALGAASGERRAAACLAWDDTGLPCAGERELPAAPLAALPAGTLVVVRGARASLPPADRWHAILPAQRLDPPTFRRPADTSRPFFLEADGVVQGPYRWSGEGWAPLDGRGFTARLPAPRFEALCGAVPGPDGRLAPHPVDLDELLQVGAEPVDPLDGRALRRWLAALLEESPGERAALAAALARLGEATELPAPILARRKALVARALAESEDLAKIRADAVDSYLRSPDGQQVIANTAERWVSAEVDVIWQRVMREQAALEQSLAAQRQRLEAARQQERAAEKRLEKLQEDETRALLELVGRVSGGAGPAAGGAAEGAESPLRAEPLGAAEGDLPAVAAALCERMGAWPREVVVNLLLALLTGPWLLLAGPPGVGKSTLARELLRQLGHGPGTGRYLELVVRREWQDDAPLFGFWHPGQGRWSASSEGFVERLLKAADDHQRGLGGLYGVLLEELNLAAPEHYLARPISAFEDADPQIRLYGDDLRPANAARYPAAFPLAPAVRLVGTVNVDETVERLSPRFLSRASVFWMAPDPDALLQPAPRLPAPDTAVHWGALLASCEAAGVAPVDKLMGPVRFLHHHRVPGAPSPRTLRGMERYLAASRGLLDARDAQDFLLLQRVLPGVRGVGERYRGLLDDLVGLLEGGGWRRSAARCAQMRERGEEIGDFYDFFHA